MTETPEQRIARWAERDAIVGLDAEAAQLRHQLTDRDAQIETLGSRCAQLANRVAQLEMERSALQHQLVSASQPTLTRRVYRRARSLAARMMPKMR